MSSEKGTTKSRAIRTAGQEWSKKADIKAAASITIEQDRSQGTTVKAESSRGAKQGFDKNDTTESGHPDDSGRDQPERPKVEIAAARNAKQDQPGGIMSGSGAHRTKINAGMPTKSEAPGPVHARSTFYWLVGLDIVRRSITPAKPPSAEEIPKAGREHQSFPVKTSGHATPEQPVTMASDDFTLAPCLAFEQCTVFISHMAGNDLLFYLQWGDEESQRLSQLIENVLTKFHSRDVTFDGDLKHGTDYLIDEANEILATLRKIATRVRACRKLNMLIDVYHTNIAPRCIAAATAPDLELCCRGNLWKEECDAIIRRLHNLLDDLDEFGVHDHPSLQKRLDWLKADVTSMLSAFLTVTQSELGDWKWRDQRYSNAIWSIWVDMENGDRESLRKMFSGSPDHAIIVVWHKELKLITSHTGPLYWFKEIVTRSDGELRGIHSDPSRLQRFNVRSISSYEKECLAKDGTESDKPNPKTSAAFCVLRADRSGRSEIFQLLPCSQ